MKKLFLLAFLVSCTPSIEESNRILGDEGYHDIEYTGYSPFACSDDDRLNTGFRAVRDVVVNGEIEHRVVEGTLCCGIFKDCTIRH